MTKWFYSSIFYRIWKRILTWFGDIYFATELPKTKAKQIRRMLVLPKKGDVLCRKYSYYADSYFIKGAYSHSGICIDEENMVHAIAEGVGTVDIIDFIKDTDGFILIRPKYQDEDSINKAVEFAKSKIGMPYDFIFDGKEINHFYCHELTWNSLKAAGIMITPKESIVYADDLIGACEKIYEDE